MRKVEYIELVHVQELMRLVNLRSSFMDWTDSYEKYDNKVKGNYEWILRNAKLMEKG